jgi:uncharacterized membrane protein YgcG
VILQGGSEVQKLPDLTDALRDRLATESNRLTLQRLEGGATAEQEKKLLGLLSESQRAALRREVLCNTAAVSLLTLLNRADVRKELALSDETLKKLVVPAEVDRWQEVLEKLQNSTTAVPELDWNELSTNALLKLRERYDAQFLAVLTKEQREKLDALLGQPYAKISKAPNLPETGRRGGRGGFPGGPGFSGGGPG